MAMSPEQRLAEICRGMNEQGPGEERAKEEFVTCYDCPDCRGKTKIYYPLNGEVVFRDCHCISIRTSILRAKASGLGDELRRCKFSNFEAATDWQHDAKNRAMSYAKKPKGWFYLCGQVGSGKTHLCTAIVGRLIHSGMRARYMRWKDDAAELKGVLNEPVYQEMINPFLDADVLYIDDFLKTARGENGRASAPGVGDLNLAFQIVNNRYSARKITIISSEHTVDEVVEHDEAVGSRIYEMAKQNCVIIQPDPKNNYRMR